MKKIAYISGPMENIKGFNFDQFNQAEEWLKNRGYSVVNPVKIPRDKIPGYKKQIEEASSMFERFFPTKIAWTVDKKIWIECMKQDLDEMRKRKITHIMMLPGWENSRGAVMEHYVATKFLKAKIIKWRSK